MVTPGKQINETC